MTIRTSLTEELILGILAEQPRHGYQIEKLIEERGMRKWTDVGFSSIYYILEKLENKGYNITKSGSTVLAEKTRHRLIDRQPANSHFMTALSNSQRLSSKELIEVFTERKKTLEEDLQALKIQKSAEKNAPRSARQLFSFALVMLQSELNWLESEIEALQP